MPPSPWPRRGWVGGKWAGGRGPIRLPTSTCSGCSGASENDLKRGEGDFPNLTRHYDRMMARPAVIKTFAAERDVG